MNILKALFGGTKENTEETKKEQEEKDFDILKYDGVRAMRTGNMEYAVKCFSHALDIRDDDETRDYLSQALMANSELLEALNQLKILAEKVSGNAAIYLRMSNVAYLMEDYGEMQQACDKALEIENDNLNAMYMLAVAYEGQERREEAVATLTKILETDEKSFNSRLLRGTLQFRAGNLDAALSDAQTLLDDEDYTDNEDALMLMASVRHGRNELDEAEALCTRVIELDPFSVAAFTERAAVRKDKGDKDGEKEDCDVLLQLNPQEAGTPDENPERTMEQKMKDNQINPLGI